LAASVPPVPGIKSTPARIVARQREESEKVGMPDPLHDFGGYLELI